MKAGRYGCTCGTPPSSSRRLIGRPPSHGHRTRGPDVAVTAGPRTIAECADEAAGGTARAAQAGTADLRDASAVTTAPARPAAARAARPRSPALAADTTTPSS